jgi:hypothetical protein
MRYGIGPVVIALICGVYAGTMRSQESAPGPVNRELLTAPHSHEIHVDQDCLIHEVAPHTGGMKQHVYTDRGICDVSDDKTSYRDETDVDDGRRRHRSVKIREHTFRLHNPSTEPVTFILEQSVTKGWEIDSDPQPNQMTGTIATFLVHAEPGQTVSLHVGERNPPR